MQCIKHHTQLVSIVTNDSTIKCLAGLASKTLIRVYLQLNRDAGQILWFGMPPKEGEVVWLSWTAPIVNL